MFNLKKLYLNFLSYLNIFKMDIEPNDENNESIVNDFNSGQSESDNEENNNNIINQEIEIQNKKYNSAIYNFNYTYSFFKTHNILYTNYKCRVCNADMKIVNEKTFLDKICFRCIKRNPKHDVKISIRKNTFLEDIRINMISLFFLIFDCFINKLSANKAMIEFKNFQEQIDVDNVSISNIQKLFRVLRNKIKIKMHNDWKNNPLATEPYSDGISRVEIDESKIISNNDKTYYMFKLIDRQTKNARVYCVLDKRTKETLLPLIKNNIYTVDDIKVKKYNNAEEIHNNCFSTRIYSDCWSAYQYRNFKDLGFLLHRINHSVWFGLGNFHTNTVEGLWSQIKRICSDFSGINVTSLNYLSNNGVEIREYLDDWICFSLFFRDIERFKLNTNLKINLLINYLKNI